MNIVLFKPDGLGDFVLATGVIRSLLEQRPDASLTAVLLPPAAELCRHLFPQVRTVVLPPSRPPVWRHPGAALQWIGRCRKLDGEAILCLRHQRTRLDALALTRIRGPKLFLTENLLRRRLPPGYFKAEEWLLKGRDPRLSPYPEKAPPSLCGELEANRRILSSSLSLEVSTEEIKPRLEEGRDGSYLLVSPFGSDAVRDYPKDVLIGPLAAFSKEAGLPVILTGTGDRKDELESLATALRRMGLADVEVRLPKAIVPFFRLVAEAHTVLTVETSTAHLATALDKRTVVITGGGHFSFYAGWSRSGRQRWPHHRLPCYDCFWQCIYPEVRCLLEIPPDDILIALREAAVL